MALLHPAAALGPASFQRTVELASATVDGADAEEITSTPLLSACFPLCWDSWNSSPIVQHPVAPEFWKDAL